MRGALVAAIVAIGASHSLVEADVLELKTGERVEGKLERGTQESITLRVGTAKVAFSPSEVRAFYFGSAPADPERLERIAKVEADLRTLASAVSIYTAFTGQLPPSLSVLASAVTNAQGQTYGPMVMSVPRAPCGWSDYAYVPQPNGTFTITSSGDGVTVTVP